MSDDEHVVYLPSELHDLLDPDYGKPMSKEESVKVLCIF
jgi:hypothetical protein